MVQPVVLQGDAFDRAMKALSIACTDYSDDARIFDLKNVRSLMRLASVRQREYVSVTKPVGENDAVETARS